MVHRRNSDLVCIDISKLRGVARPGVEVEDWCATSVFDSAHIGWHRGAFLLLDTSEVGLRVDIVDAKLAC